MAELRTRIQLKYDSYERWLTHKDLIPLKGEVCIVNPSTGSDYNYDSTTSCLMKVGDGVTTFENLPWLSALAADVHSWAKKSETEFKAWLTSSTGANLASASDLATLSNTVETLEGNVESLQTIVGSAASGETPASGIIAELGRLQADLDTVEELVGLGDTEGGQSITDRVTALETSQGQQDTKINNLESAVNSNTNTLETLMKDENTTGSIANLIKVEADRAKAAEEQLQNSIAAEATNRDTAITNATTPILTRLTAVESSAETSADMLADLVPETDKGKSVRTIAADEINTLIGGANSEDTITNITTLINYVNENGADTAELVAQVATNTADIGNLKTTVSDHGTRLTTVENSVTDINGTIGEVAEGKTLVGLISEATATANGYTDEKIGVVSGTLTTLGETVAGHTTSIADNTTAITNEVTRATEAERALATSIDGNTNKITTLEEKVLTFIHSDVEGSDEVQLAEGGKAIERLVFNCGDSDLNN